MQSVEVTGKIFVNPVDKLMKCHSLMQLNNWGSNKCNKLEYKATIWRKLNRKWENNKVLDTAAEE